MPSENPPDHSEEDPDYQGEEGEEETEDEDGDWSSGDASEDEDWGSYEASEAEEGASEEASVMDLPEIPGSWEHGIGGGGGDEEEGGNEEEEEEEDGEPDEAPEMDLMEIENGEYTIEGGGQGYEEQGEEAEEDEEQEQEQEVRNEMDTGCGGGGECQVGSKSGNPNGVELDRSLGPNCPVCFEPWTPDGPHRVCCIPCGHLYGRSCLEKWVQRSRKNTAKCPMCNMKFKQKEIINLYAPIIAVQNDELEKELCSLRKINEVHQIVIKHFEEEFQQSIDQIKEEMANMKEEMANVKEEMAYKRRRSSSTP